MTRRWTKAEILDGVDLELRKVIPLSDALTFAEDIIAYLEALPAPKEFQRKLWMVMEPNDPDGETGFHPDCDVNGPILHKDDTPIAGYKKEPFTVIYYEGHDD